MTQITPAYSDILIIGAGLAGMQVALRTASRRVRLVDPGEVGKTGASPWAKGGVAAALGPGDTPAFHAADTEAAGAGICVSEVVRMVCEAAPGALDELISRGVPFDRDAAHSLALSHEAAHTHRRVVRAGGDQSGKIICEVLARKLRAESRITLDEGARAHELIVDGERVVGAWIRRADGEIMPVLARATVLATGGAGQLFARTSNPASALGQGLTLAFNAGAALADLEFIQFHPTGLWTGERQIGQPVPLLSEAIRGEGARLVNHRGERFMLDIHPGAELAPRDIVARAIWAQQAAGGQVFLDATRLKEPVSRRFPGAYRDCLAAGIDPDAAPIPVSPVAHYHMGGIQVDLDGRTTMPGLWACGEVAATGLHGANRLASNSLLEALVFGARVANSVHASLDVVADTDMNIDAPTGFKRDLPKLLPHAHQSSHAHQNDVLLQQVQSIMWTDVGLIRHAAGLKLAINQLDALSTRTTLGSDIAHTITLASLIAAAALRREESRGAHYRSDFPSTIAEWCSRSILDQSGLRTEECIF